MAIHCWQAHYWTPRSTPVDIEWGSVTFGNGLFVALASNGGEEDLLMTSSDGITWTKHATAFASNIENPFIVGWRGVFQGNDLFAAVGAPQNNPTGDSLGRSAHVVPLLTARLALF